MLFILALLLFPCAIVGAFVNAADEHDVPAFQSCGFFGLQPQAGAIHGRSDAAAKDVVPARQHGGAPCARVARRKGRAPTVSMLIGGPSSLPTNTFSGSTSTGCQAPAPSSADLIWPTNADVAGEFNGALCGGADVLKPASRRRARPGSSSARSSSALRAMSIPARCALPSVDLLREAYGHRRSFWGDLTPAETRRFYHELLPVSMRFVALGSAAGAVDSEERPLGGGTSGGGLASVVDALGELHSLFGGALTLEEQARLASMSRTASKLYVRERCQLPVRVASHLYDGLRHLKAYGSFRVTGMSWEQLWDKYENQIRSEYPTIDAEELKTRVCLRILDKSCCTSQVFNNMAGCSELNNFLPEACGDSDDSCDTPNAAEAESDTTRGKAIAQAYSNNKTTSRSLNGGLRLIRLIRPFRAKTAEAKEERRAKRRERRPLGKPRFSRRASRPRASV